MSSETTDHSGDLDLKRLLSRSTHMFFEEPVTYLLAGLLLLLGSLLSLGVLAGPLLVGFIRMADRHRREEPIEVGQVMEGIQLFAPATLAVLIFLLGTGLASLLVVLPGVVLAFMWSHTLFFVALRQQQTIEALSASWKLARSHAGTLLLLWLSILAITLLGSLVVVGVLVTTPLCLILITLSFHELTEPPAEA